jgi:hypothetical protein
MSDPGSRSNEIRTPMISLHRDPHFTFRFAEDRIIPRFHLEGIEVGRSVLVYPIDGVTGERFGLLMTGIVGPEGWVDLPRPIVVKSGDAFTVVPA